MGWNTHRYFELYWACPSMGALLHTLNLRLHPDHIVHMINQAEDSVLFVDQDLIPMVEGFRDRLKTVKQYVLMGTKKSYDTKLEPVCVYEDLISGKSKNYEWPKLDEWDPALILYTTGTTGFPKGVQPIHRSIVLACFIYSMYTHAESKDVIIHLAPYFHGAGWLIPFYSTMVGAKSVLPGPHPTPEIILKLIESEKVTLAVGATVFFLMMVDELKRKRYDISSLKKVVVAATAPPAKLIRELTDLGIEVIHGWGMTETQMPLTIVNAIKPNMKFETEDQLFEHLTKQGIPPPFVEVKSVRGNGTEIPWGRKEMGELCIRTPIVIREYYKAPEKTAESFVEDGWFKTGDGIIVDEEGYVKIVDRFKDLIKSGGEWISSVDLENAIMSHPKVLEACVIAVPHYKWEERPLALVVPKPEYRDEITKEEIFELLKPKFAKWWLPDDIVFVDRIAKTSVGKMDKKVLREMYKDYKLPAQ